ncbi:MAG TPA: hypothetical protein VFN74_19215, partial [Chloroflexota bacterium]|nr:hypothetical protein [Chloroflexota bacterium]
WLDSALAHAKRRNIPYLNPETWLDWNTARRQVTLTDDHALHAARAIEGLTVLVPSDEGSVVRHGRRYAEQTVSLRAGETLSVRTAGS